MLAFAIGAALVLPIAKATNHPGWWTQLYFASIEKPASLEGFHPSFSILQYGLAFIKQGLLALTSQTWVGVGLLGCALFSLARKTGARLEGKEQILFWALLTGAAAKFVVAPVYDTRIYFPYVVVPYLLLLGSIASNIAPRDRGADVGMIST
jgi:hypothetical protein